ncbi:MAG: TonB-dependent receptor domain-containing protein [Opitutaceae bacterium]
MRKVLSVSLRAGLFALSGVAVGHAQTSSSSGANPNEPVKLEKFEVTGSNIKRVDVEGPSPIKIITRQDIEVSGRTNLTDMLRELPETGQIGINEGGTTAAVRGSTALDLRGLGANNTLVIVNGRRVAPTGNNSGGTVFVDINRFPIAMVERVEVLKDGASAIYGADATAGVVNIILRKDYSGAEVGLSYGNSFKTDVSEKTFTFFGGASSGKASATVGISRFERGALKGIDTEFGRNADLSARFAARGPAYADNVAAGAFDLRSGTGPQARIGLTGPAAGQINGQNGVNIPGLAAGAAITRLPGTGGVAAGTLASATPSFTSPASTPTGGAFNANVAGTYEAQRLVPQGNPSNLYNFQEFVWLTPSTERNGINTTFRYDLTPTVTAYAETAYQANKSHIELAPSPISTAGDNNIIVPKTNYWNPFGVDVSFNFRPVDIGARMADISNDSYRLVFGLKGSLDGNWQWDAYYSYDNDKVVDQTKNAISESRLRASLAKSTPDALNIFGGANYKNPSSVLDAIRVTTQKGGYSTQDLWHAQVSGDLAKLPTGTLGTALLVEARKEKFGEANDAISTTLDDIIGQVKLANSTDARRTVKSVAVEFNAPLVKADSMKFVRRLELTAAGRFEDFSDGYNSGVKPYVGLRYQPVRSLVLRATYNEAFRSPTLPQLYGGVRESLPNGLADLRRPQALTGDPFDGAATQRLVKAGGNPNLTPELAKGWQYGFVWEVPFKALQGLSVGSSFYHIEQTNIITSVGTAFIRQNEVGGGTGDLVVRDAASETYTNRTTAPINVLSGPNGATTPVAPGQTVTVPGRIQYISDSVVNLAFQKVEGYDFELNYRKRTTDFGQFSLRGNATYLKFYGFTRTVNPANLAGRDGFPRLRIQSSILWTRKEHSAGLTNNYIKGYGDIVRDGYEVDSYYTLNAFYGWDIPAGLIPFANNTRLTFGADNVLDRRPPLYYDGVGYENGYVSRPAGRFFYVSLRKTF